MTKPVILHIEDMLDTATLTKRHLERHDLEIVFCLTGKQGLKMAEEMQPDLILLDVELPDMSGFDVCKQLRKQMATPIIFLTATNSIQEIQRGLLAGGDDYITKPYSTQDLVGRIHVRLRKNLKKDEVSDTHTDEFADDAESHADVLTIMSSKGELLTAYDEYLAKAIQGLSLTSARVDRMLDDSRTVPEIMSMMYYARLVIVDTTTTDPHMYYALGAAHALGKPVVMIAKTEGDIPVMLQDDYRAVYKGTSAFEHDLKFALKQALNMPPYEDA